MSAQLVLGLDFGTESLRALLLDLETITLELSTLGTFARTCFAAWRKSTCPAALSTSPSVPTIGTAPGRSKGGG